MVDIALWKLVLADWHNSRAVVTLTLRSGAQFTGRVRRHPGSAEGQALGDLVTLVVTEPGRDAQHDVDLAEVAAISAVAS